MGRKRRDVKGKKFKNLLVIEVSHKSIKNDKNKRL